MGERKTYIINIDGMRADYFNATGHQGCLTPALVSLAEQGIRFSDCKDTLPANTCTNHTAILTSTHAGSNGILGAVGYFGGLDFNHFRFSRKYGAPVGKKYQHHHLQVPTIYNTIKANNRDLITAFITSKNWLGNILADQDCDITIFPQNTPENCDQHKPNPEYVTPCEGFVLGGIAHPEDNELLPRFYFPKKGETVEEPPGSIRIPVPDVDTETLPSDTWVIDQALKCIDRDNPDFIYMVLMNMDFAGHLYGAFQEKIPGETTVDNLCVFRNPDATRDQLYLTDKEIQRLVDHLKKSVYLNTPESSSPRITAWTP